MVCSLGFEIFAVHTTSHRNPDKYIRTPFQTIYRRLYSAVRLYLGLGLGPANIAALKQNLNSQMFSHTTYTCIDLHYYPRSNFNESADRSLTR